MSDFEMLSMLEHGRWKCPQKHPENSLTRTIELHVFVFALYMHMSKQH